VLHGLDAVCLWAGPHPLQELGDSLRSKYAVSVVYLYRVSRSPSSAVLLSLIASLEGCLVVSGRDIGHLGGDAGRLLTS
jgi:hypothetical protein